MATATTPMTLESVRREWIGRKIFGSSDHQLDGSPENVITDIHLNADDLMYYAWSGEHIRANTLEALCRRLHQLAGQS